MHNKTAKISKVARYLRPFIQNIINWRFWIRKKNALLNLINNQPDIDKIYSYAKDPYDVKYQYLIKKREKVGLKHYNDFKAFIEYSNDIQHVYKNIEDYNPRKKCKVLIVFDDMIAEMFSKKKLIQQ